MSPVEAMQRIDALLTHVWMVRTFLKHSEEAQEDEELAEVHRELYDYMLSLGAPLKEGNASEYLRQAKKKFAKLKRATELFTRIQPEISTHMNFQMAMQSLNVAVRELGEVLQKVESGGEPTGS